MRTFTPYGEIVQFTGTPGADGAGYKATSTTSNNVGVGSKTWTTQSGLAYTAGARVRVTSQADVTVWMEGVVTSYSNTTIVIDVETSSGAGIGLAAWNINLTGEPGVGGGGGGSGTVCYIDEDANPDPNGVMTAQRPAVCYSQNHIWVKTNATNDNTGWHQLL